MRGEEGEGEGVDRSLDPGIGGALGQRCLFCCVAQEKAVKFAPDKEFPRDGEASCQLDPWLASLYRSLQGRGLLDLSSSTLSPT